MYQHLKAAGDRVVSSQVGGWTWYKLFTVHSWPLDLLSSDECDLFCSQAAVEGRPGLSGEGLTCRVRAPNGLCCVVPLGPWFPRGAAALGHGSWRSRTVTTSLGRGFSPVCVCAPPPAPTPERPGPTTHSRGTALGPGDLCAWPAGKQDGAEGTAEAVLPVNGAWQWKSELKARTFMFSKRLEWKGCLSTAKVTCNTFK